MTFFQSGSMEVKGVYRTNTDKISFGFQAYSNSWPTIKGLSTGARVKLADPLDQ